jgi:HSP20 family protein
MGSEDEVVVSCELPGVDKDTLDISVTGDTLTIKAERKPKDEDDKCAYHRRERRYGSFARSVSLPVPVDAEKAKAEYEDGVLTLRIPKSPSAQPKKIAVSNN